MTEDRISIQTHDIFKIPVFVTDLEGITDDLQIMELLDKEFENNKFKEHLDEVPINQWHIKQTRSNLHKKKEFEPFCRVISDVVHSVIKDIMEYDENYFVDFTAMWGNRQSKGTFFRSHAHPNNVFGGVFYPNEGEDFPPITFERPFRNDFAPTVAKSNTYNGGISKFPCKKDCLIVFPAWLEHNIPVNPSDEDRYSISFNIMLRGIFGWAGSNQSTLF